ncbi:hypothetical protein CYMTET_25999, partial [Cymbomonas tetramitiformis]
MWSLTVPVFRRAAVVGTTLGACTFASSWTSQDGLEGATGVAGLWAVPRSIYTAWTFSTVVSDYKLTLHNVDKQAGEYAVVLSKLHDRNSQRLLTLCRTNGGIFVKAGQIVAESSALPLEYREAFSALLDRAKASSYEEIEGVIAEALHGEDIKKHFSWIGPVAVASASLAQVHQARLLDGTLVAVKVQHANLRTEVGADLTVMQCLAVCAPYVFEDLELGWLVKQLRLNLEHELDFINEGKNSEKLAASLQHRQDVVVPKVFWNLSSCRVLTTE